MKVVFIFTVVVLAVELCSAEKDCSHTNFTPFSVHKEICGSDGVTYINLPHLDFENCMNDREVTVAKEGWCDEEEGKKAEEQHKQFMREYANAIRKAIKEGKPTPYIADAPRPNLDDYPEEE